MIYTIKIPTKCQLFFLSSILLFWGLPHSYQGTSLKKKKKASELNSFLAPHFFSYMCICVFKYIQAHAYTLCMCLCIFHISIKNWNSLNATEVCELLAFQIWPNEYKHPNLEMSNSYECSPSENVVDWESLFFHAYAQTLHQGLV